MYCIGLTGKLASGKSTVASYFKELGIDVINADHLAKTLTTPDKPAFQAIIQRLGTSMKTQAGELDRTKLRQFIFQHPEERLWLESLLHPLIRQEILQKIHQATSPYCVIEIPLLRRKEDYPYLNRVLLVRAHTEDQIARCMIRDQSSHSDAEAILATQPHLEPHQADDVLMNTGTIEELHAQVLMLHQRYLRLL